MWLLNTWNMVSRTWYLILINFKWPHVASGNCIEQGRSSFWLLAYWSMKYPQSHSHVPSKPVRPIVMFSMTYRHILPPHHCFCCPHCLGLLPLFHLSSLTIFFWLSMSPYAPQAFCKSPSLHCWSPSLAPASFSALCFFIIIKSCLSSHSHEPLPFHMSFILQWSCQLAIP